METYHQATSTFLHCKFAMSPGTQGSPNLEVRTKVASFNIIPSQARAVLKFNVWAHLDYGSWPKILNDLNLNEFYTFGSTNNFRKQCRGPILDLSRSIPVD